MEPERDEPQVQGDDQSLAEGELVEQRASGLYGLPVVGRPARTVRDFYDGMKPAENDSFGVRTGKKLVRGGTVVVATGAAMMVVL